MKSSYLRTIISCLLGATFNLPLSAETTTAAIDEFCQDWSEKLRTVEYEHCKEFELIGNDHKSVHGLPLLHREFTPINGKRPKARVLAIGGVHGDEYSAISISYLWMKTMLKNPQDVDHHWLFLPLANPDGLFVQPATRQNANGVDLNRNFPTSDWDEKAIRFWHSFYAANPRRNPGTGPASEPETQWQVSIIKAFQPDAIISIHAPYGLLDYDGPDFVRPDKVGHLRLHQLGTFPGSLGRYAGEELNIPVLTIELDSAGRLPNEDEIKQIWHDMGVWIDGKLKPTELDF